MFKVGDTVCFHSYASSAFRVVAVGDRVQLVPTWALDRPEQFVTSWTERELKNMDARLALGDSLLQETDHDAASG